MAKNEMGHEFVSSVLQNFADECRSIMEDERQRDREILSYRIERIERTLDALFNNRHGDVLDQAYDAFQEWSTTRASSMHT